MHGRRHGLGLWPGDLAILIRLPARIPVAIAWASFRAVFWAWVKGCQPSPFDNSGRPGSEPTDPPDGPPSARRRCEVMFPDADYPPPFVLQRSSHFLVPPGVSIDLPHPVAAVGCR